jgi:hypothetical protein
MLSFMLSSKIYFIAMHSTLKLYYSYIVYLNVGFTNDYVNTGKVISDKEIPSKLMMIHQIIFHSINLKI